MLHKTILSLFATCSLLTDICKAQWQPDVRLTNDPAFSSTSHARCIASNSQAVHVVWHDGRDGHDEIYYKRSTDGGISWGADILLSNNSAPSAYPSVSVSGSVVHVVWRDFRDGNSEIYYKRSTNGGISWGADTRLTINSQISDLPSVSVSGSVVHVVWQDTRLSSYEIYYKHSTNEGISWGADTRLTNDSTESYLPSVSASGQVAHVVWRDNRDGNYEIYYKRSTSGGISWGPDTRLTNNSSASSFSSVSASGQVVHVAWQDNRDGNYQIYYKRSTDGGISWGTDTRLTNSSISGLPSVSVSGQVVHVVWWDYRDGHDEIYYKRSTDGGITWGTDTRLTNYSSVKQNPSVSISGSVVHVVWADFRDGNFEIYYKRDSTGSLFPPSAPNLVSPPNNSQGQSLTPLLAWDTVANSSSYRAQVSTDSLFGQTAFDTTVSLTQVTIPPGKLANNIKYFWRASASNAAGNGPWSEVWNFRTVLVSTTETGSEIPETFSLSQNYPNPFNPSTRIAFSVPASSAGRQGSGGAERHGATGAQFTTLKVFDVLGREVATLVNENLSAGSYEATFDAKNLASGVYLYRLTSEGLSLSRKLLLTK